MTNDDLLDLCRRRLQNSGVGPRLLVAFSGGLDSSVLVDVSARWYERGGPTPELIHVDHGLRPESGDDARFCRRTARRYDLPVEIVTLDLDPDATGQDEARRARLAAIAEHAVARGIDDVALAHHGDDRIESFLLNLRRGTGLDGLAPMSEVDSYPLPGLDLRVLRPFIDRTRARLEDYARRRNVDFVTDPTNRTDAYRRNRIRHHLVPELAGDEPTRRRILEAVGRLEEERRAARIRVDDLQRRASLPIPGLRSRAFRRPVLAEAPPADLARLFGRLAPSLDADSIERIRRAVNTREARPRHLTLSGCVVTVVRDRVAFHPSYERGGRDVLDRSVRPVRLRPFSSGRAPFFGGRLDWALKDGRDAGPADAPWDAVFDADRLTPPLYVAGPTAGVRLRRLDGDAVYHQKLTKLFSAHRVDADCRWRWPCLYDDRDRLVWAAGLPRGARAPVGSHTDRRWHLRVDPPNDLAEIIQY